MKNNKALFITGGRVIDSSQKLDETGNLLISGGKIAWLGKAEMLPPYIEYDFLDARGMIVCPGFIDLHCHLRQPGNEAKETIATGTRAAAKGGFTTICCMPNTNPPIDNLETIDYVKSVAIREGIVRVLPISCITRGRNGNELVDMANLAKAGIVAFSDDGSPVMNDEIMKSALQKSLSIGLPVIDHCENTGLSEVWDMNSGEISRRLALRGIPADSEESMIKRDIELNLKIGGKLHIAHVSTAGSVEIIRQAKKDGVNVTAEVTPHHLTLTEDKVLGYNTNAKVNPPLRTQRDIEALIGGLRDNTIDAIATDHAPHTENDKGSDFRKAAYGISGLETAFGSLVSLAYSGKLTLDILIAKLTCGPAAIIGDRFGKLGTLEIGAPADITIYDPAKEWVVDTAQFASKGKNTPLVGETLRGKVIITIYKGKVVYQDTDL